MESFIENVQRNGTKEGECGPEISPINFDTFSIKHKDDRLSMLALVDLAQWSTDTIRSRAHMLKFFVEYHKDSPKNWKKDEAKDEEGFYVCGLDLEDFMDSDTAKKQMDENQPWILPDNYSLAKKVMKRFRKVTGCKTKIEDISFRETAIWQSRSKKAIKDLGEFIQDTYIEPLLAQKLKEINATGVTFTIVDDKAKLEFVYPPEVVVDMTNVNAIRKAGLVLAIYDELCDWRDKAERETVQGKAFMDIAKKAADRIVKLQNTEI